MVAAKARHDRRTSTVMAMVEGRLESKMSQLYALLPSVQLWKVVRSRHDILGPSCGGDTAGVSSLTQMAITWRHGRMNLIGAHGQGGSAC